MHAKSALPVRMAAMQGGEGGGDWPGLPLPSSQSKRVQFWQGRMLQDARKSQVLHPRLNVGGRVIPPKNNPQKSTAMNTLFHEVTFPT